MLAAGQRLRVVLVGIVAVVLPSCGNDGAGSQQVAAGSPERGAPAELLSERRTRSGTGDLTSGRATWIEFASPAELLAASEAVALVEPLESADRLISSRTIDDELVLDYFGRRFRVLEVVKGGDLRTGDEIVIAHGNPTYSITEVATGAVETVTDVGGGFVGELDAARLIVGLTDDDSTGGAQFWSPMSSAHGIVALSEAGDGYVVADPDVGGGLDGRLQVTLAGAGMASVMDAFRAAASAG